ncbi:MAG: nickel-responsive transcriptional regulator NikR [Calditrichaceae bacterium]|nr:nickel-responsive transcriptional regulator NikR [Calditrichaceae bacterium]MBN2710536.1 nickel-responsive transcriptional regulator NikR [Calditrichaceae bacterium]RQV96550.1 MAG: nickel-responsive transcriptional regulator NikR [Calditrichota bacterium]
MTADEKLVRFGVSLPTKLIRDFDTLISRKHYPNRSEAIRDLIRRMLIQEEIDENHIVVGVLHLLYDHHKRDLSDKLDQIQHDHHQLIISTTHVHLDHDNCLEVILLKGKAKAIRDISDQLIAIKGVKNGQVCLTSKGGKLY